MRPSNEVITSQIPRSELVGLLDSMTPFEQQRVTAEMMVVMPPDDTDVTLHETGVTTSTVGLRVRFIPTRRRLPSWAIVAASTAMTLALAGLVFAAA